MTATRAPHSVDRTQSLVAAPENGNISNIAGDDRLIRAPAFRERYVIAKS